MTSPPLQSREQEAREMLALTPHLFDCKVSRTPQGVLARCDCGRKERAMIAFADAERERTLREAAEVANVAYRSYIEPTEWDYGGQDACTKIEREILAIRNPLYQHGEPK